MFSPQNHRQGHELKVTLLARQHSCHVFHYQPIGSNAKRGSLQGKLKGVKAQLSAQNVPTNWAAKSSQHTSKFLWPLKNRDVLPASPPPPPPQWYPWYLLGHWRLYRKRPSELSQMLWIKRFMIRFQVFATSWRYLQGIIQEWLVQHLAQDGLGSWPELLCAIQYK